MGDDVIVVGGIVDHGGQKVTLAVLLSQGTRVVEGGLGVVVVLIHFSILCDSQLADFWHSLCLFGE